MSWLFSLVLVEEYSDRICSAGEPFAQSNGAHIQQAYCAPDKMTEFSRLSRFGMTFKPLTDDLGEALLTLYLADFHAKTSAQLEKAQESTENDRVCGNTWQGSLAKYDPDLSLWKTAQCSLLADWEQFSETWPRWGSMRNGELFQRQIPMLRTSESESGYVPNNETFFHTQNTTGMDGGSNSRKALKKSQNIFPTPRANDAEKRGNFDITNPRNGLSAAVKRWPTPVASMSKGSSQGSLIRKTGKSREKDRLDHAVMASDGGQLNPTWVEWLMGWPQGWTDLKPLEMGKFQEWQQQHSPFLEVNK